MSTRRATIASLLRREIPERMGLNEHFWPHIIENAWGAQGVTDGDFVRRFDLDYEGVCWWGPPGPRKDLEAILEDDGERITRRDAWGAITRQWKHKAGTPEHIGFTCTSPEIWRREFREQLLALDVRSSCDPATIKRRLGEIRADDRFAVYASLFVFEDLRRILGDVCMLESLASEPEWITDFCEVMTRKNLEYYALVFREAGLPDGIHIYDDLGYTQGPFCSPRMHRQLIAPWHRKLFGFFKDHGLPVVLHTCGDFRPHLPAIVESGVDCIQACEAKTGMDVVELAKDWKDQLCFMGNLDIRPFESGDRTRITAEVMGKIEGMKRLRAPWIFMSDHSIPPTVTVADYEYALELYRAHGRY